ncbi:MAG: hypothetical protein LBD46_02590, partial [Endomicrobium sp.]|nr:hypothetical protein [Endomicrobium sp.]
ATGAGYAINAGTAAYALTAGTAAYSEDFNKNVLVASAAYALTAGTAVYAISASDNKFDIGGVIISTETRNTGAVLAIGNSTATANLVVYGTIYATNTAISSADLAEIYPSNEILESGDVVIISETRDGYVERSRTANDTKVAGVISTEPGVVLNSGEKGYKLALVGRVPIKVNNEGGNIKRGDLLVASSTPGYAMKAADPKSGTIIGKALENFVSARGKISALVNLQ